MNTRILSFHLTLKKKIRTGIAIFVAGLFSAGFLIPDNVSMAFQENETIKRPSYAGFADIQAAKKCFIIVGDTQGTSHWELWRERNDRERKLIIDEITKRKPAFVIHLGDLTARGSSKKHWQQFDDFHKGFREERIPCFPVLGNHELYGADKSALETYFKRFPHLGQKRWYSFPWKNVGFILVESNFSSLTKEQIEEQSKWYLSELEKFEKNTEIDFIIVCCHQPPFTNSRVVRPGKEVKVNFAGPFLQSHKTQIFLSGHSHSYERFQMKDKFFIVSGGGGGPRHKVMIDPRKRRHQDFFPGPERRFFHFCEIENHHDTLAFRVVRLESDGTFTVVDPFILQKTRR